jgi:hypothetical protein
VVPLRDFDKGLEPLRAFVFVDALLFCGARLLLLLPRPEAASRYSLLDAPYFKRISFRSVEEGFVFVDALLFCGARLLLLLQGPRLRPDTPYSTPALCENSPNHCAKRKSEGFLLFCLQTNFFRKEAFEKYGKMKLTFACPHRRKPAVGYTHIIYYMCMYVICVYYAYLYICSMYVYYAYMYVFKVRGYTHICSSTTLQHYFFFLTTSLLSDS